jgi:hypothetical protein
VNQLRHYCSQESPDPVSITLMVPENALELILAMVKQLTRYDAMTPRDNCYTWVFFIILQCLDAMTCTSRVIPAVIMELSNAWVQCLVPGHTCGHHGALEL